MEETLSERLSTSVDATIVKIDAMQPDEIYLDLSNSFLTVVPQEIYRFAHLEGLFLENNRLEQLPDEFFENLPELDYLDLRRNRLQSLPSSIGLHRRMRTLLLEGNRISKLPLTLGFVETLTALSLTGNPLSVPPIDVVEGGVQSVVRWLRVEESMSHKHEESNIVATRQVKAGSQSESLAVQSATRDPEQDTAESPTTDPPTTTPELDPSSIANIRLSMPKDATADTIVRLPTTVSPELSRSQNSTQSPMEHEHPASSPDVVDDDNDCDGQRAPGQRNYTSPNHADLFGMHDSAAMLATARPLTEHERERVRTTSAKYRAELHAKMRAKSARRQHADN